MVWSSKKCLRTADFNFSKVDRESTRELYKFGYQNLHIVK